jgi:phospholipid/cholesterol/gamma-HCH transport system permease protein
MFIESERDGRTLMLRPVGQWCIDNAAAIAAEFEALGAGDSSAQSVTVDAAGLDTLDLSGAWLLRQRLQALEARGARVQWRGEVPAQIAFVEKTLAREEGEKRAEPASGGMDLTGPLRALGHWGVDFGVSLKEGLVFFGRFCFAFAAACFNWKRMRWPALVRQIHETGVQAVPIVALIAFLISVIIAYMGASELRKFGAEIFVVDLVTVGVLRELGVLLTAIIVAGRSGSAFAAEIGVMKLNDEVDALKAIGTDPMEVLVMPRVLGLMIALPLLTMVADAVGLLGGCLLTYTLLDMPPTQYFARVQDAIAPTTFWAGMMKAPVFAFLIAFIGTLRGIQVRDSSRELGRLTTVAVVQSIFLVILADAIFATVFLKLDI